MKYRAEIDIMPHPNLLDPQGKAVAAGLQKMNMTEVLDVRVGRHITLTIEAATEAEAKAQVETACTKLLANAIMEGYTIHLHSA
jgi:phosphoribosylformylglycinamidine synthase